MPARNLTDRFHRILFAILLIFPGSVLAEWLHFSDTAMTTKIDLMFWSEDPKAGGELGERVLSVFHQIDEQMSRYKESSEVSLMNREAAEGPVEVSQGLIEVLTRAKDVSELSEGAFDVSFGSVGYLYDFRNRERPSEADLEEGLSRVNYQSVLIDAANQTVEYGQPGVRIDLGGIAKGYAVDKGIELLQQQGVRHARLSAGGDMRLLGDKRGKPWIVGLRDPRSKDRNVLVIPLSNTAVSTSGDYERFYLEDSGERVHHILSPSTGKPAMGVQSVTILGQDALTTDGLSTAVFVMGAERGLALVNQLAGVDAVIIDDKRQLHYSDGLMSPEQADAGK